MKEPQFELPNGDKVEDRAEETAPSPSDDELEGYAKNLLEQKGFKIVRPGEDVETRTDKDPNDMLIPRSEIESIAQARAEEMTRPLLQAGLQERIESTIARSGHALDAETKKVVASLCRGLSPQQVKQAIETGGYETLAATVVGSRAIQEGSRRAVTPEPGPDGASDAPLSPAQMEGYEEFSKFFPGMTAEEFSDAFKAKTAFSPGKRN